MFICKYPGEPSESSLKMYSTSLFWLNHLDPPEIPIFTFLLVPTGIQYPSNDSGTIALILSVFIKLGIVSFVPMVKVVKVSNDPS